MTTEDMIAWLIGGEEQEQKIIAKLRAAEELAEAAERNSAVPDQEIFLQEALENYRKAGGGE